MSDKKANLGFRVTEGQREELKVLAAKRRTSVQALIEDALSRYLAKIDAPPPDPPSSRRSK